MKHLITKKQRERERRGREVDEREDNNRLRRTKEMQ